MSEEDVQPPPPRPRRAWRRWVPRAVFESLLIVLSLLMALGLDGWREERAMERRVSETRRYFIEEIRSNRDRLRSAQFFPHHQRLLADLRAAETDAAPGRELAAFKTGIHPFLSRDGVWRSTAGGEILARMPPREVFMLSDVYRMQEELSAINRSMYPVMAGMQLDPDRPMEAQAQGLRHYLADVVGFEGELLRMYDAALARLEAG